MAPKFQVGLAAFFISLALDILTKHLVSANLAYSDRIPVIEGFFYLTHVRNTGAAFGLFRDAPVAIRLTFFIGISAVAIAIIVHHSNPINELSIDQLSDIYSGKISNWSELGGEDRPIVKLSRETNSGTHVYFLEQVLRKGDKEDSTLFSPDTLLLPSSEGIMSEVRDNPNALGYDGLGYVTDDVKVVAVSGDQSGLYVLPSIETVNNAQYPISRDLYMYTAGEPTGRILAYLEWILQADAQTIVSDLGFVPATP